MSSASSGSSARRFRWGGSATTRWRSWTGVSSTAWRTIMAGARRNGVRSELPELLAEILAARGAEIAKRGTVWEAMLNAELSGSLGVERVRLVASPAGRAARGAEMDAAMTERILLLGRSRGEVARLV